MMKLQNIFAGVAVAVSLIACENTDPGLSHESKIKVIASRAGESPAAFEQVRAFLFSEGKEYHQTVLDLRSGGEITLFKSPALYFYSGPELPQHSTGIAEEAMKTIKLDHGGSTGSAPDFYWAKITESDVPASASALAVEMRHGTARIDLDAGADADTKISGVRLVGAPAETFPFDAGEKASDATVDYLKEFDTPYGGGVTVLFNIFESSAPVTLHISGTYKDFPIAMDVTIPRVVRNKVYTVRVLAAGSTHRVTFTAAEWEEGDTLESYPDANRPIRIDPVHSVIPQGVTVDFVNNRVDVPETGAAGMRLAFLADAPVVIASEQGENANVTVGEITTSRMDNKVMSVIPVDVRPQTSGRMGYSLLLGLKLPMLSAVYDFVDIRVPAHKNQVQTVEMAGCTWMAFNACGDALEDQVYLIDGLTTEDMYRQQWVFSSGGLFQWGRKYRYDPWRGYNPSNNLGNQTQDTPWQSSTHVPCPEGYRIPSVAELEALLPNGTVIPCTYNAGNGEAITATVHLPEATGGNLVNMNGTIVKGVMSYMRLTSNSTGNVLIFPILGYKGDKSTSNDPFSGRYIRLWSKEPDGTGGWARTVFLDFGYKGGPSATVRHERFQAEGFAAVRCIKTEE